MASEKREIIFATNNQHKLNEVRAILGDRFKLLSLEDISFFDDIAEDFETLEENASQKAWFIYRKFGVDCFADDTGLEVDALNGEPGVYSARYAGSQKKPLNNMQKLLANLETKKNRGAQFRTVISLIFTGKEHLFEGVVRGEILKQPRGEGGFGYDPVFQPHGYSQTFAEMDLTQKNSISHRALAMAKLTNFLLDQ
jgi:XTP/dITP diphosphohydrolase